jgi:hypothetical protein
MATLDFAIHHPGFLTMDTDTAGRRIWAGFRIHSL